MKYISSYIHLTDLRFHAYHGVLPQERATGNDYRVDLRIKYNIEKAMTSDELFDTLDYSEVFKVVAQEMYVPSQLVERVAGRIGERLFRRFPTIEAIDLKIMKLNPPMGADCGGAGVEVHLENDILDKLSEKAADTSEKDNK
ncbi:MAG: dihydroneopterin aldolase [Prevotellaceae bacterium]|nr:dihydroneopterin aldolase [Prevotellaceae bacterium]